jgi:hypothetical protein
VHRTILEANEDLIFQKNILQSVRPRQFIYALNRTRRTFVSTKSGVLM